MAFPNISELPEVLHTKGWAWRRFASDQGYDEFWIGTDTGGVDWLVKMRGNDYAHRECAFDRFAQHIGINCQTAVYLKLSLDAEPIRKIITADRFQAALYFFEEHPGTPCGIHCPLNRLNSALNDNTADPLDVLHTSGIRNAVDWPKADFLACLCGASEPSGRLINVDHQMVIVDSELMFSTEGSLWGEWGWGRSTGRRRSSYREQLVEGICEQISALTDTDLAQFARLPRGFPPPPPEISCGCSTVFAPQRCSA